MIRLTDGPAEGTHLARRAPLYLRATVDRGAGRADVLDQLEDTPRDTETVHVYRRQGPDSIVHLNFSSGSGTTGYYASAIYQHVPEADGETLRDNAAWRAWVTERIGQRVDRETGKIVDGASNDH